MVHGNGKKGRTDGTHEANDHERGSGIDHRVRRRGAGDVPRARSAREEVGRDRFFGWFIGENLRVKGELGGTEGGALAFERAAKVATQVAAKVSSPEPAKVTTEESPTVTAEVAPGGAAEPATRGSSEFAAQASDNPRADSPESDGTGADSSEFL